MKILDIPQSGKCGLTVSQNGRYGQVKRILAPFPPPPQSANQKIFVAANQVIDGHESIPATFVAVVPAAA